MSKITRVKYFTPEKLALINKTNARMYQEYLRSRLASNIDVKDTTYKVYTNNFNHFLVYLSETYGEDLVLDDEYFLENAVEIMEGYMVFCQITLKNNKKTVNNKLSAVSSYFHWLVRRKKIKAHPFDGQLERIKGASEEKIISEHFLTQEQVDTITDHLATGEDGYDIIDQLIWGLMMDSANRVGAITSLKLSQLDLEDMKFDGVREKLGYQVEVTFNEGTKEILEQWLEQRKEMDNLEIDSLFITRYGGKWKAMDKSTIQDRIKRMGLIIGIKDFRSHSIRKTTLNLIFELTNDITIAAEMANHKSIDTTQQSYIKPRTKTKLREAVNKARKEQKKGK